MTLYAGLDWAANSHALCVLDTRGTVVRRMDMPHTADGLARMGQTLRQLAGDGPPVALALERPTGLLVDTLVEQGVAVVPIHPNVVKAARARYSSAGAKTDRGDAYVLADLLRTDGHRFRPLQPCSDALRALRAQVRTRDDLVATRVGLANQLRSLLESFWPGAVGLFADIDSPIALSFLQRYPAPKDAARLGEKRMAAFLAGQRYSGRRKPLQLLAHLQQAPVGQCGQVEEQAKRALVLALVGVLQPLLTQIAQLTQAIEHEVAQLPEGQVVMSFPRAGRVNAAQIVTELGDVRERYASAEQLAAEGGVAPVTRASGKHSATVSRFACNKRLRRALTCWADNSRHSSAWAAALYQRARARGCDHPHAVRIVARAWCGVLWRAWHDGVPYEEDKHRAAVTARPVAAMPA
jgi:transposase